MTCKNCGNLIPDGLTICPACGTYNNDVPAQANDDVSSTPVEAAVPEMPIVNDTVSEATSEMTFDPIIPDAANNEPSVINDVPAPVEEAPAPTPIPDVVPTVEETVPVDVTPAPVSEEIPADATAPVVEETTPVVDATPEAAPVEPVVAETPAVDSASEFAVPVDNTVSGEITPDANNNKKGNKSFLIIVIVMILVILGLGVAVYFKFFKGEESKKSSNTNSTENKNKKVEIEEKDPSEIVVNPSADDDNKNRNKVEDKKTTPVDVTTPSDDNPSTPVDTPTTPVDTPSDPGNSVITTPTGNEVDYAVLNYKNINFRIPTYVSVIADPSSDDILYLTDNTYYSGAFALYAGDFITEVDNPTIFLTKYFVSAGVEPQTMNIIKFGDIYGALVEYSAGNESGLAIIFQIGNQAMLFFDVSYLVNGGEDYLLGDLAYIATHNEILGTFSKSSFKSSTYKIHTAKKPIVR